MEIYKDISLFNSSNTSSFSEWGHTTLIKTIVYDDRIELVYKEISNIALNVYTSIIPERVFKKTYSCKDGAWHESEPIYGEIIPPQYEEYNFD
jgi:hypothetical protein